MKGKILAFSVEVGAGLIRCKGNKQYIFYIKDWDSDILPANDMLVDFVAGLEQAHKVMPAP